MDRMIAEPWIKLRGKLDQEDYDLISGLQELCSQEDHITLKLELDYKLEDANNRKETTSIRNINEFMYFDGEQLIGYIGICGFGGTSAPLEITGMVHPGYRRMGIFTVLHGLVMDECRRRNAGKVLVLCDRESVPGQGFLKKVGAVYQYSEFEMYLQNAAFQENKELLQGINFRKATNADAGEIARQNAVYFGDPIEQENEDTPNEGILMPEEEEKRGMTIYLAEKNDHIIGKVHLHLINGLGGIYGLGVLPEYRGKGYGRAILRKAIHNLRDLHAKDIMLQVESENATALGLYKSCGFQETSVMDYYELG